MANIEFKVPVALTSKSGRRNGKVGYETRTGMVINFELLGRMIKCAVQENDALVHVASGMVIARLHNTRLAYAVNRGDFRTMSRTEAAQRAWRELIMAKGGEYILSVIDAAPVIN